MQVNSIVRAGSGRVESTSNNVFSIQSCGFELRRALHESAFIEAMATASQTGVEEPHAERENFVTKNKSWTARDVASSEVNLKSLHFSEKDQIKLDAPAGIVPLPAHPDRSDDANCILGFAVMKKAPWNFGGIYSREDEAKKVASNLGPGYEVHYGLHRFDSDDSFY